MLHLFFFFFQPLEIGPPQWSNALVIQPPLKGRVLHHFQKVICDGFLRAFAHQLICTALVVFPPFEAVPRLAPVVVVVVHAVAAPVGAVVLVVAAVLVVVVGQWV